MSKTSLLPVRFDWEEVRRRFPCPPHVWTGAWAAVGAVMPQDWDVWLATYTALAALAARNFHWYYARAHMYGMAYSLCIAPTGSGKQLSADVCSALLPATYRIRDAVQSGPGVFTALQGATKDAQGAWASVPTLFIVSEWTKLAKNTGIQHSTLGEDLNNIFHRPKQWNVTRSNRGDSGGDQVINTPTLSIFGTATPELFVAEITETLIHSGFINRYLILPGGMHKWDFWPPIERQPDSPDTMLAPVAAKRAHDLTGHVWGHGQKFQQAFTPQATRAIQTWGIPYFGTVMQDMGPVSSVKKRLHFYAYHIAMLSAWARLAPLVEIPDVRMAQSVIETSATFVDFLYAREMIPLTISDLSNARIEQALLTRIGAEPGVYTKFKLRESLRSQGITMAKLSAVLDPLIRNSVVKFDPDTRGLVLMADRPIRQRRSLL